MRLKTVAILAVVFLALLAVVVVDRAPAASSKGAPIPVVAARPSQITRIVASDADGPTTLEAGPVGWTVQRGSTTWPADERRISAGLRLLTSAVAQPADAGPADSSGRQFTIESDTGTTTLVVSTEGLSGSRPATIDGQPVRLESGVADLFRPESMLAWTNASALPGFDASVTSIRMSTHAGSFELSRVGPRWGLSRPVHTAADTRRVEALIGALASATVVHTADEITIGERVITVDAASSNRSWSLSVDATGRGESQGVVDDASLSTRFTMSPEARSLLNVDHASLIASIALDVPASDISRITLGDLTLERVGRGWSDHADQASALLDLITSTPCASVAIEPPPPGAIELALTRFGELPAADLLLSVSADSVVLSDGRVNRSYERSDPQVDSIAAWLSSLGD